MESITAFLASQDAIQWLGLPGFVVLLSFLFYRYLVEKRIVSRLTQTGSLIVILSIIAFFSFALHKSTQSYEKKYSKEDAIYFLEKMNFSTDKKDIEKVFGPPSSNDGLQIYENIDHDSNFVNNIRVETYQKDNSIYLGVYYHHDEIIGYGIWAKGINTKIPMYFNIDDDLSSVPALQEFSLQNLHSCGSDENNEINTRTAWFLVGPCYFGAAGKYNNFAFAFDNWHDKLDDCQNGNDMQKWWALYTLKNPSIENSDIPCNSLQKLTATAVLISSPALEVNSSDIPSTRYLLYDFVDRIGFGKGFI